MFAIEYSFDGLCRSVSSPAAIKGEARPRLRTTLLVVGEFEHLFDVARTATEAVCHVERRDALVAPPQDAPFDGTQPGRWFRRGPSREIRQYQDTFDELLTAIEPATDLCRHYALGRQPADPSFEGSKVGGGAHQSQATATSPRAQTCRRQGRRCDA